MAFWTVFGDKGDNIDVWMIKFDDQTNQIVWMSASFKRR